MFEKNDVVGIGDVVVVEADDHSPAQTHCQHILNVDMNEPYDMDSNVNKDSLKI